MLMFVVANLVGSTIQITTLPLPVLSTLQASGLVFNTICATLVLNEPFTRWSFGGTVLVAVGAILIALFGALPEPTHNLEQLLVLLGRWRFVVWMVGTFLIMALVLVFALILPRLTRLAHQHNSYQPLYAHHYSTNVSPRVRLLTGMGFGFISAILSAHSLLLAKSAVELILTSLPFAHPANTPPNNQFTHYQSYLILLALVAFALSQLYFLHRGLKLASTSVLYPFVFCVYNVVAILDGLIYFNQTDDLPPLHAGLIALGTVILLAGVLALSWRLDEQGLQQEREYGLDGPVTPTAQVTALAPGMGVIEDTATESPSGSDDVAKCPDPETPRRLPMSESTPLLPRRSSTRAKRTVGWDASADEPTPSSGYGTTRTRRGSMSLLTTPTPRRTRFAGTPWDRTEVFSALMDDKESSYGSTRGRRETMAAVEPNNDDDDGTVGSATREATLRRSRTEPFHSVSREDGAAWKKRKRRSTLRMPRLVREEGSGGRRSVSTSLIGERVRDAEEESEDGKRAGRRGVVDWVGGLVVGTWR